MGNAGRFTNFSRHSALLRNCGVVGEQMMVCRNIIVQNVVLEVNHPPPAVQISFYKTGLAASEV